MKDVLVEQVAGKAPKISQGSNSQGLLLTVLPQGSSSSRYSPSGPGYVPSLPQNRPSGIIYAPTSPTYALTSPSHGRPPLPTPLAPSEGARLEKGIQGSGLEDTPMDQVVAKIPETSQGSKSRNSLPTGPGSIPVVSQCHPSGQVCSPTNALTFQTCALTNGGLTPEATIPRPYRFHHDHRTARVLDRHEKEAFTILRLS